MITNEIKARVFAQYMPNTILINGEESNFVSINRSGRINRSEHNPDACQLILKPLSAITDEDAIRCSKYSGWDLEITSDSSRQSCIDCGKRVAGEYQRNYSKACINGTEWLQIYQYLQSKGYALPYMEYSVEDLVKAGIYKLEE